MSNHIGEINYNKFGSKMKIIKDDGWGKTYIFFEEYEWTYIGRYDYFKNGTLRCPYEPRVLNKGYIGEGKYSYNKHKKIYNTWCHMLKRCYSEDYQNKKPTYIGCEVCEEWFNFQNFAKWFEENYYEIEGETIALDKDILVKNNKIYSPNTCVFVPERINTLFTKADKSRGKLPIGIVEDNRTHHFRARCSTLDENGKIKRVELGSYKTHEEAFIHYKQFKENYIKQVADEYKPYIPKELYEAMYRWEVDIDD